MTNASVAHLLRNIGQEPEDTTLYFLLGNEYVKLGLLPQAIAAYEEAISRKIDHLGTYLALSEAQERLLLTSKARHTLQRGLSLAREKGYALGEKFFDKRLEEFDERHAKLAQREGVRMDLVAPFALRARSDNPV
jgi:tetratricopeptide (TPR) repeat protein